MLRYTLVSSRRNPTAIALCQAGADSLLSNDQQQQRWKSTQEQHEVDSDDKRDEDREQQSVPNKNDWRSRLSKMSPSSSISSRAPASQHQQSSSPSKHSWKPQQRFSQPNQQQQSGSNNNNRNNNMNRNNNYNNNNNNRNNTRSKDYHMEEQKKRDPLMKFFEERSTTTTTTTNKSSAAWRQRAQQNLSINKNESTPSLWRSKLTDSNPQTITDMRDVSGLRAAFLKSTNATKRKENSNTSSSSPSSQWRQGSPQQRSNDDNTETTTTGGGAREYRKRVNHQKWQERQQQQHQQNQQHQNPYQKWVKLDAAAFYGTKQDLDRQMANEKKQKKRRNSSRQQQQQADDLQVLLPPAPVSVTALSGIFRVKIDAIHKRLRDLGERKTTDDFLVDVDTMEVMALDLGLEPIRSNRRVVGSFSEEQRKLLLSKRGDDEDEVMALLPPRPPVVCIMGHVDHGKTTLMDALRRRSNKNNGAAADGGKKKKKKMKNKGGDNAANVKKGDDVAGTEAGGITQVISAFQVLLEDNSDSAAVTFLDTPGHAAFRAMRESGSHAADVIVLVIAADDGVSPQTVEILDFYKSIVSESGGITLVVAMTKVDKPGINVDESRYRIENELMEHGIVTESFAATTESEYGPPVQLVPVSGVTGDGLDDLIDSLVLQSEVMELRADPNASAEGIVMDARIEKGVGVVADCIVRWGSLERGDIVLSGVHCGKVKALKDSNGGILKKALPSQPVRIIGFKTLPKAGDPITCVESEEKAEQLIERRILMGGSEQSYRSEDDGPASLEVTGVAAQHVNLQRIHDKYDLEIGASTDTVRIPIIIKADADGTLAALRESMVAIGKESFLDIIIDPIGQGIGPITISDVEMANLSNAAIFSFNVKQTDNKEALAMIETEGVSMKSNNVIYSLLDDAKDIFANYLPTTRVEHIHGKATIQAIFEINNSAERAKIAGLRVTSGAMHREKASTGGSPAVTCHYRVMRSGEQISPKGEHVTASSLKKVKTDVLEVKKGEECGLGLEGYHNYQEGDIIECYSVLEQKVKI